MKPERLIMLALALATFVFSASTNEAAARPPRAPGALISVEQIGEISRETGQGRADDLVPATKVRFDVALFRVAYWTRLKGRPVRATGLFAAPIGNPDPKGIVAYFHGTTVSSRLAPSSVDRADGDEEASIFGGTGFYVVLPDYIGLGSSSEQHPYLLTRPSVDASLDMLRAVRTVAAQRKLPWSPRLYMFGFSQGGQVVAGVHRALEQKPLPGYSLQASAGIAGPYDLRAATLAKIVDDPCPACIGYLAWASKSYTEYYGQPLNEMLQPKFANLVPTLFDGSKAVEEILPQLPGDTADLFQPETHLALRSNRDGWFPRALDENETWRWVPKAPFRIYFGDADADVPAEASKTFYRYAKTRGGNVTLHPVGKTDHIETMRSAYPNIAAWFEALSSMHYDPR